MSIKGRLKKLEQEKRGKRGECPGCGFAPGDIRTVVFGRQPKGGPVLPFTEIVPEVRDQPGRPLCSICGGYMPPIAIIEDFGDGDDDENASVI